MSDSDAWWAVWAGNRLMEESVSLTNGRYLVTITEGKHDGFVVLYRAVLYKRNEDTADPSCLKGRKGDVFRHEHAYYYSVEHGTLYRSARMACEEGCRMYDRLKQEHEAAVAAAALMQAKQAAAMAAATRTHNVDAEIRARIAKARATGRRPKCGYF